MSQQMDTALLANRVQKACLLEADGDVDAGLLAAEYILSNYPLEDIALAFDPNEPRDKIGEWTTGGNNPSSKGSGTAPSPPSLTKTEPQPENRNQLKERLDRKSTRLNSSHIQKSRMPSSA